MSADRGDRDGPRFAIIASTTPALSFVEQLDAYAAAGATGIGLSELRLGDIDEHVEQLHASELTVSGCFLSCSSVLPPAPPTSPPTEGPRRPDLATPEQRVESIAASIRRLAPLEPDFFYVLPGPLGRYDVDAARSIVADGLRELADVAAETGAGVAVEIFHSSLAGWSYLTEIADGVALLDEIGRPNAWLAVDVWHLAPGEPLGQLRAHAPRFAAVHINDRRADTRSVRDRVLPGDGIGDVAGILGAVDAGGFRGWYELEVLSDDGSFGNDFPDSLWKRDPAELVREGHDKFQAQWKARRLV